MGGRGSSGSNVPRFLSQGKQEGQRQDGDVMMEEEVREKFERYVNTAGLKTDERIWTKNVDGL